MPNLFDSNGLPLAPFRTDRKNEKVFIIFNLLFYLLLCFSQASDLKFRDGKFKIVQLTDLHWVESDSYKLKNDSTCHLIREVIRIEDPDLVVLTGDVVVSWNAKKGWEKLTKIFGETKTPFVVTFGNHDEETDMNNAQILDYLCTRPYNLTYDAEKDFRARAIAC